MGRGGKKKKEKVKKRGKEKMRGEEKGEETEEDRRKMKTEIGWTH